MLTRVASRAMTMVLLRQDGPIAELQLNRPEALNAVSTAFARELTAACGRIAADTEAVVVVVTSTSPRAFCVGADLKERNGFSTADLLEQREVFREVFGAVRNLPQPAIAAVAGYALGGGCEIALSCDVIVADRTAQLGLTETSVGLVPGGGGTQLLTRRVGAARAADLVFTARKVAADEALSLGLVDRLVDVGTAREAALALGHQIAANSPTALRAAKRALREGADVTIVAGLELEDAAWREAVSSADREEGIAAFVAKRPPRWPSAGR